MNDGESSIESRIEEDLNECITLLNKKIRFVETQFPVSEDHQESLDKWKAKLEKQKTHLENARKKINEDDESG